MTHVAERIEVDRPVGVVYDQWTQFEEFPTFMDGVESVRQLDEATLHWTARIAGVTREWDARIVDQHPDERVSWVSTSGTRNDGAVTFRPIDAGRTEVQLELDIDPEGFVERAGDALGLIERRASGDLRRFKEFIESRPAPTGGWRGEVEGGVVVDDETPSGPSTGGTW